MLKYYWIILQSSCKSHRYHKNSKCRKTMAREAKGRRFANRRRRIRFVTSRRTSTSSRKTSRVARGKTEGKQHFSMGESNIYRQFVLVLQSLEQDAIQAQMVIKSMTEMVGAQEVPAHSSVAETVDGVTEVRTLKTLSIQLNCI